jgi:antitoxin YefM
MTIYTTYTSARSSLASLMNQVSDHREVVIVSRRGKEDVALIAGSELESLLETAYLLRSPANAKRLTLALTRALSDIEEPIALKELREKVILSDG